MKRLEILIDQIKSAITDKIAEAKALEETRAFCLIREKNFDAEAEVYDNGDVVVIIDQANGRVPENVERFIEGLLPRWCDVSPAKYDEWDEHGFRSEFDYFASILS